MTISTSDFYDVENIYFEEDEWFDDHIDEPSNYDYWSNEFYYEF